MSVMRRPAMRVVVVLPYALIVLVIVVDVLAGSAILLSLLAAPAALASATGRPRYVLSVGALAFAVCVGAFVADEGVTAERGAVALSAVALVALAAAYASEVRLRAERRLVSVQTVADAAQNVILRQVPRRSGHFELAVSYVSATVGARIGGDLYEALPHPGGLRIIVGDVQGKGLTAVGSAVTVLTAFRAAAPADGSLQEVAEHIEEALERREQGEEFVTAVLADCTERGDVTLLSFGHPPPLVHRADGTVLTAAPEVPGPPLGLPGGLGALHEDGPGRYELRLEPGDRMLFYTDGTTEARNAEGDFFPLPDHADLLGDPDLADALAELRDRLAAHVQGPLDDDAAMLLLRFAPAPDGT